MASIRTAKRQRCEENVPLPQMDGARHLSGRGRVEQHPEIGARDTAGYARGSYREVIGADSASFIRLDDGGRDNARAQTA